MRMRILLLAPLFIAVTCLGQNKKNGLQGNGNFTSIRNADFSQLIGASAPGISLNYNTDKTALNGSFTLGSDSTKNPRYPRWIQLTPSIGTTTTVFDFSNQPPLPDFSIGGTITWIVGNTYYYDGMFTTNYNEIKNGPSDLDDIETNDAFQYTEALRHGLNQSKPALQPTDKLYTAKRINWFSIKPEWGGTKYTFYDKTLAFAGQIYKPYLQNWGVSAIFSHYWYVNNDDVHWDGWPTTRFFYYNITARYGANSNIDALKKTTINDISSIVHDSASSTTRQQIKSTSAYSGKYESYNALTVSGELLYSFIKIIAVDAFFSYNFIPYASSTGDTGTFGAGLYFYTNSSGSKVNIGLYYQHSLGSSPEKQLIGLKTKVPINW